MPNHKIELEGEMEKRKEVTICLIHLRNKDQDLTAKEREYIISIDFSRQARKIFTKLFCGFN